MDRCLHREGHVRRGERHSRQPYPIDRAQPHLLSPLAPNANDLAHSSLWVVEAAQYHDRQTTRSMGHNTQCMGELNLVSSEHKSQVSRRAFIRAAGLRAASAGIGAVTVSAAAAQEAWDL